MKYIVPLDSEKASLELVGGKGKNLSLVLRANLPVPNGFTVTTIGYKTFVEFNSLNEKIRNNIDGLKDKNCDAESLEECSKAIRSEFQNGTFPIDMHDEISFSYKSLCKEDNRNKNVAVRSSATAEDLPDLSFAGQQDTYLNINGTEHVLKAVIDCFASLWTARAIQYRIQAGINDQHQVALAVVVQLMIPSEASGVLFTANPLTENRNEITLEVVNGLGESLVSGLTEPDRYVIQKDTAEILHFKIGAKALSIMPMQNGGTETIKKLSHENDSSLDDNKIIELINLCLTVEKLYGSPQDIEWGYANGKFHILQSRPITTLFKIPQFSSPQVLISFAHHQGVMQPITPLGQDVLRCLFAGLPTICMGQKYRKELRKQVYVSAAGRLFYNCTHVLKNSFFRKIILKALSGAMDSIYSVLKKVAAEPEFMPTNGLSLNNVINMVPHFIFGTFVSWFALFFPNKSRQYALDRIEIYLQNFEQKVCRAKDLNELLDLLEDGIGDFFPTLMIKVIPRFSFILGQFVLLKYLSKSVPNGDDLTLSVLRGLPHNPTSEMDLELWKVTKEIKNDKTSYDFFIQKESTEIAEAYFAKQLPSKAQNLIEGFMEQYGMRGLAEIDFGVLRWRENPTQIMDMIKNYLEIDEKYAPDKVFTNGKTQAKEATNKLGHLLGIPYTVKFMVSRIRSLVGLRETPKFALIRTMGIIRPYFIEEGERLVKKNILEEPHDIFLLSIDNLREIASNNAFPKDYFKSIISERKEMRQRDIKRKRIPLLMVTNDRVYFEGISEDDEEDEDIYNESILKGEAVSPGVTEGKVRIVHDPLKANLKSGEIMVCEGTDPAWTPLFLLSKALITEVGGLMTHGSVVAREYGIPAVVGISQATERLKTGQLIRVDGSKGKVFILEDISEE